MWSYVNLNKVGSGGQIPYMQIKFHQRYYMYLFISWYLSCDKQSTLAINATKIAQTVFSLLLNKYISNITDIYNPGINLSWTSQTIYDHMFSDPNSDHIFSYFRLHTCIIFCFFLWVVIFHLLRREEGVGIYCKLILNWIELTRARILFPVQYRTGIHKKIRNTTWRIISKAA